MHQGCVAGANDSGEGSGGVVADIAKLSVGREDYGYQLPAVLGPERVAVLADQARVRFRAAA